MTVRLALASESVSAIGPSTNGVEVHGDRVHSSTWEEWFLHASPRQRAEAMGLAQQQGVLYPHQLPPLSNGATSTASAKDTAVASLLSRLLAGKADALPCHSSASLVFFDDQLDDVQQQAVVRALSTPDLFLLEGLPGTGKSRVVAEIILQAAARGQRILFLAPHAASVDVVLARLVGRSEVFALRLLDPLEKPEAIPPWLRGFTLDEQRQSFLERTLAGARGNSEHHESACRRRGAQAPLWGELRACAERNDALEQQQRRVSDGLAGVAAEVASEADAADAATPFWARLRQMRAACDDGLRELESSLATHQADLSVCDHVLADRGVRVASLEPGYQAKKHRRFWTPAFWLNLFNAGVVAETESLIRELSQTQERKGDLQQRIDQLQTQGRERREQFERERQTLIAEEIETRRRAWQYEQQRLQGELQLLTEVWSKLCAQVLMDAPTAWTPAAVTKAQELWIERTKHDEQQCQFARQWLQFVEESGPQLAERLPGFANVVASTIQRWQTDVKFRAATRAPFDFVIVEDAESLADADMVKLARQAERCVLVASALGEAPPQEKPVRSILTAAVPTTSAWRRIWQALGGDAGRWPCTWRREQGRLVCQLVPLGADDRQHLESESLADASNIELRILHRPRSTPRLAQVLFGPQHSFEDAFRFMVCEVQEFPLEPLGQTGWWSDDAQCVRRRLGPASFRIQRWLAFDSGLRLGVVADDAGETSRVAAIEFDKSAGWDRARADDWLARQRPIVDAERSVFLQMPYRFSRPIAKMLQAVVRPADWLIGYTQEKSAADHACEFVAVPALTKHEWPREGAGLELDLAAAKQADRLPAGLRPGLPMRGFVNYAEAQVLIRRLESWAQNEPNATTRVAVLALYQGQVELLRRLVQQSELLRGRSFPLEIALPSRMRQRECELVFLSLTRSHGHRAVAFGEDVLELPLALVRATANLIVFGDPGTLYKRTHWTGPVDHLDARAAHDELLRLERLTAILHCHEPIPAHVNGVSNGKG